MTILDSSTGARYDLQELTAAAGLLDRWTLRHLRIRLQAMEIDDSPELDRLTDHAAHLSRRDRRELVRRVRAFEPAAPDYDDGLDYEEILRNKNSLG
jgi:hypothetical protein